MHTLGRTSDAARRLNVSQKTVRQYVSLGLIRAYRLRPLGDYHVDMHDVDSLLTPVEPAALPPQEAA